MSSAPVLRLDEVSKAFTVADGSRRWALHPTSLSVAKGESVAVVGRSGSGKSTLLHLAAGVETPTGGSVVLAGQTLSSLPDRDRARLRRDHVGLVFQFFHLVPHLTVEENVQLPAMIAGDLPRYRSRVRELLARVDLDDRRRDRVDGLSGGEMQRVAICRALLRSPSLLLADEPTGNLDDETGQGVMALIAELVAEEGSTLLFVTHSRELAAGADRILRLRSGALVEGSPGSPPLPPPQGGP